MASSRTSSKTSPKRGASSRTGGRAAAKAAKTGMLDDRARRDIVGVGLSALAVALLIAVVSRTGAPVAESGAIGLRMLFGIGAYLIPVFLLLWGVSFFVRTEIHEGRTGLGLGLVVLAVISMAALATPGVEADPAVIFAPDQLAAHGGYIGSGVTWLLASSVGVTIGYVFLTALVLIGLVVTGMSISAFVDWVRDTLDTRTAEKEPKASRVREHAPRTVPLAAPDGTNGVSAGAGGDDEASTARRRRGDAPDPRRLARPCPRPARSRHAPWRASCCRP